MDILQNVNGYVGFLIEHKLTTNQFLLLYLLYTESMAKDEKGKLRYTTAGNIYKWHEESTGWTEGEIKDLIAKDFAICTSKENISIDSLILTSKFSEIMFIEANFAFQEFFDTYPSTVNINGETAFLKGVDLNMLSLLYSKHVNNSATVHKDIMEALRYGIDRGIIKTRIDKFLSSKMWKTIADMMHNDQENYGKELH
jgi:hypothetical protein